MALNLNNALMGIGDGSPGAAAVSTSPTAFSCWETALDMYIANLSNDPEKLEQARWLRSQDPNQIDLRGIMGALVRAVTAAEAEQWRVSVRTGNTVRTFSVREKVNDIMRRLQTYTSIGDTVSQAGGPIAVGVWGIFRFVLQTGLDESNSKQQVITAISMAMDSTTRAAAYEQSFLPSGWQNTSSPTPNQHGLIASPATLGVGELRKSLHDAISNLYSHTIRFALKAHRFFKTGAAARLASSVVRPFEVRFKDVLDELYLASDRVEKVANALHLLLTMEADVLLQTMISNLTLESERQTAFQSEQRQFQEGQRGLQGEQRQFQEQVLNELQATATWRAEQTQMNQLQISELEESRAFREERRRQFAAERERQEDEIRQAKLNFLRDCLAPDGYKETLMACNGDRLQGTCRWILSKSQYQNWEMPSGMGNEGHALWVHGIPGCGKTFLASYIIQQAMKPGVPVIYYFCISPYSGGNRNAKRNETMTVIRTLIYQLALLDDSLVQEIRAFVTEHSYPGVITVGNLWDLFVKLASRFEGLYCIVDGLDECGDRRNFDLMQKLVSIKDAVPNSRVLITSRNIADISDDYARCGGSEGSILRIVPDDVFSDNHSYIIHEIDRSSLGLLSQDIRDEIAQKIEAASDGLILYSKMMILVLSYPRVPSSRARIMAKLQDLPKNLTELYDRIYESLLREMSDEDQEEKELLQLIFTFAVFGTRPLTLAELREACMVKHGSKTLAKGDDIGDLFMDSARNIEHRTSPLIEVVRGEIRVIHASAKQFLEAKSRSGNDWLMMSPEGSNYRLLQLCMEYLCLSVFGGPLLGRERWKAVAKDDLLRSYPFLGYAAAHWSNHLEADFNTDASESARLVLPFLNSQSFVSWVQAAIILSTYLDTLAHITYDIERWISKAPKELPDIFVVNEWLHGFRNAVYDWYGAITDSPTEVHFIDQFSPLRSSFNKPKHTQKLLKPQEKGGAQKIYPSEIGSPDLFEKHGTMVALATRRVRERPKDSVDDPVVVAIHDWHLGNCIKVLRHDVGKAPEGTATKIRNISFSPDGNRLICVLRPEWPHSHPDDDASFPATTVVWAIDGLKQQSLWAATTSNMPSLDFSIISASFVDNDTVICPSGMLTADSGKVLASFPHGFFDAANSLNFRGSRVALVRSGEVLEIWEASKAGRQIEKVSEQSIQAGLGRGGLRDNVFWVVRDISTSGSLILLTDYESVAGFDVRLGSFKPYFGIDSWPDIRASFSPDETKFATLITGYNDSNHHELLCTSTTERVPPEDNGDDEPVAKTSKIRIYAGMKPPEHFCFDADSTHVHTCSVQWDPRNFCSVFSTYLSDVEADGGDSQQPQGNQTFVFEFGSDPDVLYTTAVPHPPQPLVMDCPITISTKSPHDNDKYEPAKWFEANVLHQRWTFSTGEVTATNVIKPELSTLLTAEFFRKFPMAYAKAEGQACLRVTCSEFELIENEYLPGDSSFPFSWDMEAIKAKVLSYRATFRPPLDEDRFSAHLNHMVPSLPDRAVALVGSIDKLEENDGDLSYPLFDGRPFIFITSMEPSATVLWEWVGEEGTFNSNNPLVSFALGSNSLAFSTRDSVNEGCGLYASRWKDGAEPRMVSKLCAAYLVFNKAGDLLYAISGTRFSDEKFTLTVYDTMTFSVIRQFQHQSPFSDVSNTLFLSWRLAEDDETLEKVHISREEKSRAVHARLSTTSGRLSTRTIGSLPTMRSSVEISKIAVNHAAEGGTHINVAFQLVGMPPLALSFPEKAASDWHHSSGESLS